ncbi:fibronectin type III domain-containing protein [Chryseobacterium camelliae]|uniref:Fibronectin type III domain-containing protein n=1 Tax=Chryseobacterium camelliae TaxID=1265445 RepID=A0ABY7QR81_9FLAO|nr:fibronectin type III domain-containing protein [Chryseobacterium camelliae]WBV61694.1 fibronectin type III domain-containing protein [Chryseobacterium camelliae]
MRKNQPALVLGALGLFASSFALAQNYQQMPVQTGFTADVIANGTGSSSVTANNDVDGVSYAFVAKDFLLTSTSTPINYGIPVDGIINSVITATPGLSYQLASLSANNSLRLAAVNDAGTLVFTTPKAATKLYMLSTNGSGSATVSVTVNFSDGTNQLFTGINIADWYNGTNIALQGIGRIKRPGAAPLAGDDVPSPEGGTNPRLYQNELVIDAANQAKLIQSVVVTKTAGTGSANTTNIFAFSADAYSTCVPPTLQPVGTVTANSAAISWTAPAGSTVASYDIYYSTSNTVPASTATPNFPGETGTSKTIPGLNSNTTYYYWVRTNCSTGTSQSAWSFGGTFKTACAVFTVPYTENFDTTSTGSASNNNAPSCWSYLESASFPGNGYVSGTTNAFTSPNAYYLNNSSATSGSQMLVSPPTTSLSNGTKRVRFYAKSTTAGTTLLVGTLANAADPATFTQIGSPLALTTTQTQYTVNIPAGTDVQLAFKHGLTATSRTIYIDDITVQEIPSCLEPTAVSASAITSSGATIGWTAPGTVPANGYEVYYSTSNVAPTSSTILNGTNSASSSTTSAPISGLSPASTYYVWVRSVCSGTDKSIWSLQATFITACVSVATFTQNFDTTAVDSLPPCWTSIGTNTTYAKAYASSAMSAPNAMYIYTSGTSIGMVSTPELSTLQSGSYVLKFKGRGNSSAGGVVQIGYLTNPTDTSTFVSIGSYTASSTTAVDNFTLNITGIPAGVNKLVLKHTGSPSYSVLLDDISYELSGLATSETSVKKNEVNVYPNPFTDVLSISDIKDVKSVSVMDVTGRLVKNIENPSSVLHLGDLKQGLYLVVLNMNDGSKQTIKAIKK